jgi:hypothetical protein
MNVVCFTVNHPELSFELIQNFLKAVRDDGKVFFTPTSYKGTAAIRVAISNWQTLPGHVETAFNTLTEVWKKMKPVNVVL